MNQSGGAGQTGTSGQAGGGNGDGDGGTAGSGAFGGLSGANIGGDGGGGGGWSSNGFGGVGPFSGSGGDGPPTFAGEVGVLDMDNGGFGGGGGGGESTGGGGGGYSGGGGGGMDGGGGGGGSYFGPSFTDTSATASANDGDGYTYNRYVNHIPAIAQHFMLLEALKSGLTEERIAAALDVSLDSIRLKRDMLNGICPEAVQVLIDKPVSPQVFAILRKMKAIRQIEAAEHMVAGGTFTIPFAKALLAVTKPEMLEEPPSSRKLQATSIAARSMLEEQNEFLLRDLKSVEESYGTDVLTLTVSFGYLDRLIGNPKIGRCLERYHLDILQTLQKLLSENKMVSSEIERKGVEPEY